MKEQILESEKDMLISESTEQNSLDEFTKNVLVIDNSSDDSLSTLDPETCKSVLCTEHDDPFEGIFYRTSTGDTEITIAFVSIVFFEAFRDKFLADYSDRLESCASNNRAIFNCTTHVKSLRCDIKIDYNCRNVVISGVGRIVWRNEQFPRIARVLFVQYVQMSDSQLMESRTEVSHREQAVAGNHVSATQEQACSAQPIFTSTPLAPRSDHPGISGTNTQQPILCTPLFTRTEPLFVNDRNRQQSIFTYLPTQPGIETQNINEGVLIGNQLRTGQGFETTSYGLASQQSTFNQIDPIPFIHENDRGPPFQQPLFQYIPSEPQQTIGNGLIAQPAMPSSENILSSSETAAYGLVPQQSTFSHSDPIPFIHENDRVPTNQQPLYQNIPTEPQQTIGNGLIAQQAMLCSENVMPSSEQEIVKEPRYHQAKSPSFTCVPYIENRTESRTESQNIPVSVSNAIPVETGTVKEANHNETDGETLKLILHKIRDLESLFHNVKNSIMNSVGSQLQEMKTILVSITEKTPIRTYADVVIPQPVIISPEVKSISIDEGYDNSTTHNVDGDSSQTHVKTLYHDNNTEDNMPVGNHIPVRVKTRQENNDNQQSSRKTQLTNRSELYRHTEEHPKKQYERPANKNERPTNRDTRNTNGIVRHSNGNIIRSEGIANETDRHTNRSGPIKNERPTSRNEHQLNRNGIQRHTESDEVSSSSTDFRNRIQLIRNTNRKTLLIGDSLLNSVNPKGLVRGIQKHSKSGAQVCNIIEDISMYDMKSFSSVVVMVGGNDASNRTDTELFEEKYDQLISLIKMGNQDCDLYISKIVPRGDTDIQEYNSIISRLATYWENHGVYLIQATEDYFYGQYGCPTIRYYSNDGIHLANAGVKRLLHAINSKINVVADFENCVYKRNAFRYGRRQSDQGIHRNSGSSESEPRAATNRQHGKARGGYYNEERNKRQYRRSRRECFACRMIGHLAKDCWNNK